MTVKRMKVDGGTALSPRETDVLTLLAKGATTPEIAKHCALARGTVVDYIKHIYRKLEVTGRAEAAVRACEMGLHCAPAAAMTPLPDALLCTILVMEGHEPGQPIDAPTLRRFANRLAAEVRKGVR